MTAYGAVNCYVWFLMIAYLPCYPATEEDMQADGAMSPVGSHAQFSSPSEAAFVRPTESIGVQTDVTWLTSAPGSVSGTDIRQVAVEIESAAASTESAGEESWK
jgi:hypothetical protein